ncbi:MAG: HNH endonuclease [Muribaculaceae bacterium]|nr:HNH endonuclease [Muribaculaceae bacterium]
MKHNRDYKKLINTSRWLQLRKQAISAQPLCVRCREEGRLTLAQEVHHIVPVETAVTRERMEALMYDPTNLMPLCRECHFKIHRSLGKGTKREHKQREAERLDEFRRRFFGK